MYDVNDIAYKLKEYKRCKEDPQYFIENYIKNYMFDNEPIKLHEKQKEILHALLHDHRVIINGSRQVGKTTVIEWFFVWLMCFFPKYTAFVMSKKADSTAELLREIHGYYETVPSWLKPKVIKDNAFTKEYSNGSRIKGVTVPKGKEDEAGRGMRGGFIFLDEVAFFDADIEKVYTALLPTTTFIFEKYKEKGYPYGLVLVSTPGGTFGRGKFFFDMWTKALRGEINFKPIRFHWSDVERYRNDPNWIKEKRKEFHDERKFNQEYELVFLGTDDAFLPDKAIQKLQQHNYEPVNQILLSGGSLDIYDEIDTNKLYLIGIDTATGYSSDYSAIVITDYETGLPIAEYNAKVPIDLFKQDIIKLIETLNLKKFFLIPENNGVGASIAQWLYETSYDNFVYVTYKDDKKRQKVPGLVTNTKTRPLMLEALYETVVENAELIRPKKLKQELIAIERKGSRIEAPYPHHDDLAFAYAFTCYVRNYGQVENKQNNVTTSDIIVGDYIVKQLYNMRRTNVPTINSFSNSGSFSG